MHARRSLEFMRRLASRVLRPHLHLIHFHGVLAPNAFDPGTLMWSTDQLRYVGINQLFLTSHTRNTSVAADEHAHGAPPRMGWTRLLKRVFNLDLEHCPQCGGEFRIIAAPFKNSR